MDFLTDRVAVVTGGASGLGLAVAHRLAAHGARVTLWGRRAEDVACAIASSVSPTAEYRMVDVTDASQVAAAAASVSAQHGRFDILVCCAGTGGYVSPCEAYPLDEWNRQLAVNLSGTFYSCRAAIPWMKAGGWGRIVNVSSMAAKDGNALQAGYVASKAGVIALTKSLGKELAGSGILANAVAPTMFDSPMSRRTRERMPPAMLERILHSIPLGRMGEVNELAALITWICSPANNFTTGFTFDYSGGRAVY